MAAPPEGLVYIRPNGARPALAGLRVETTLTVAE